MAVCENLDTAMVHAINSLTYNAMHPGAHGENHPEARAVQGAAGNGDAWHLLGRACGLHAFDHAGAVPSLWSPCIRSCR